jgi:hypothetical protein
MPNRSYILDDIQIPRPCTSDWDSMIGNDQVRFCEHCNLSVHDVSAMTRKQAEMLVFSANGKLCLRYYRNSDGEVVTADNPPEFYKLTRRVSRFAAGTFMIAFGFSSVLAAEQSSKALNQKAISSFHTDSSEIENLSVLQKSLAGVIKDINGSVIVGATVLLKKDSADKGVETVTGDDGHFAFESVEPGVYVLRVTSPGFKMAEIKDLHIIAGQDVELTITLHVGSVGGMAIVLPSGSGRGAEFGNSREGEMCETIRPVRRHGRYKSAEHLIPGNRIVFGASKQTSAETASSPPSLAMMILHF